MPKPTILDLPTEILGEIFKLLCPGSIIIPSMRFATLWSVAQTCSRWRNVSLGRHHLWNSLSIIFQGERSSDRVMVHFTKQCLLRSHTTPLFLTISEKTTYAPSGISFLIPHSARIRRLVINAQSKLSFMTFPNLKSLYMKTWPFHYTLMERTPALVELRIDDELPGTVLELMARRVIWRDLRVVECHVSGRLMDLFMDMLEARNRGRGEGKVGVGVGVGEAQRITGVVIWCQGFRPTDEQKERIYSLHRKGVRLVLK